MLPLGQPPSMEASRVSCAVNTPRNNREDLLQMVLIPRFVVPGADIGRRSAFLRQEANPQATGLQKELQPNPSGTSVRSTMKIVAFCGPIVTPPTGKVLVIRVCWTVCSREMKIRLSLVMWK